MKKIACLLVVFSLATALFGDRLSHKPEEIIRHYDFRVIENANCIVKDLTSTGGGLIFFSFEDLAFIPAEQEEQPEPDDSFQLTEGRFPQTSAVRLNKGFYQGPAVNIENRSFTVETWLRRQKNPDTVFPRKTTNIVSVDGEKTGWKIETSYDGETTVRFCIGSPERCAKTEVAEPLPENKWFHLAVTWDSSEMKIYIEGTLKESSSFQGEYFSSSAPLRAGPTEQGNDSIILDLEQITIYNRVLSSGEIQERAQKENK